MNGPEPPLDDYGFCVEDIIERGLPCGSRIVKNHYGCLVLCVPSILIADIDNVNMSVEEDYRKTMAAIGDLPARLYQTHSGARCFILDEPRIPLYSSGILKALGSDKRYNIFCDYQKYFSARLTPKPWRVHDDKEYAVCKFLGHFNCDKQVDSEMFKLVEIHDARTKAFSNLPLA